MLRIWFHASRPGSVIKVALPVGVGLTLGYAETLELEPRLIGFGLLFAWLVQLLIIFLNDYADAEADQIHTEQFPEHIDKRVVPLGLLTRRQIGVAGLVAALGLLATCGALYYGEARSWAPAFGGGAILFLWLYSFPPIRLNYRGLGELLETFGVGAVLPWAGFYFYTGRLDLPWLAVTPLVLLALASALTSGLKHLPGDRVTGKKTAAVLLGTRPTRILALVAVGASVLLCGLLAVLGVHNPLAVPFTVGLPILFIIGALREVKLADHEHLFSLAIYKRFVHRAIYATHLGIIVGFLF